MEQLYSQLAALARRYGAKRLVLFGSRARGDNRNNSEDSRYADIGKVNKKYITGKLWFQISPRKEIGLLDQ